MLLRAKGRMFTKLPPMHALPLIFFLQPTININYPTTSFYYFKGVIGSSRAAVEKVASRSDGMAKGGRVVLDSGITGVIKWIGMLDSK